MLLLLRDSKSRVCAPCLSLDWHSLKTIEFHNWWTIVTIEDLRRNISKHCPTLESSSSDLKKVRSPDETGDVHQSVGRQTFHHEGNGDDVGVENEVEDEKENTSDADSEINFKHQRGRRSKKSKITNLASDMIDFGNALDIPIPLDIPTVLAKVGGLGLEVGASSLVDDIMIAEALELVNMPPNGVTHGQGKELHLQRDLIQDDGSASPTRSHQTVKGPSTFEVNAKTIGTQSATKGTHRAPAPSISAIRITPTSRSIVTTTIKVLGNEYLVALKKTPFDKVSDKHGEATEVYKAIRLIQGDPEPLKCKVDEYVWAVKSHLAFKASVSDHHCAYQIEETICTTVEELKKVESDYDVALTRHKGLQEGNVTLKRKEAKLMQDLEGVRQQIDQVAKDLRESEASLPPLEAGVLATKERIEELESIPVCSKEEIEIFKEQERKLLEHQSTLDTFEWLNVE